jgi:beta-glucanase (GH16 family)
LFLAAVMMVEPGYKLVWADEFEKAGRPDPANWTYETGFVRNEELQWYQPQNARVEDGRLLIEGKRERVPNPSYDKGSNLWQRKREFAEYTSASLKTRGLREWTYGRLDVRAKIDARAGLWPAIWTLGVKNPWPRCGELDIMEFYRDTILANACWADGTWDTDSYPIRRFLARDKEWAQKWHLWRTDWDKDFIRIYLDGELLNEIDLSKTLNPDGFNPFHQPHYLILNLANGSTGGDPSSTEFPARFEVDYVRLYQKG